MKDSMFLELNIVAHNIDGIASIPSIQKLHNLLEFINENSIDIMAISETNIDYRQEYFINQNIKSKVYSIIFSERDQKTKGSGTALVIHNRWMKHYYSIVRIFPYIIIAKFLFVQREIWLELYDVCRVLYPDAELFTHEKWYKNKNRSAPISKLRIDQIWITHKSDVIPVEFLVHSSQMITNNQLQNPDLHQDKRIVDIKEVNYEIQLGDEKNTDGEEIKRRFNELWDNIISAISIAMNIELSMKLVKYLESRNTRHKLSFADKTMRHTTKLGSLIGKICKDQDFIAAKDAHPIKSIYTVSILYFRILRTVYL
ncbi:hypothetical protein C1646_822567 [Rhizophagus diaphanus]|nr:hypothetical protein C1646_822567 [Rhizophagus diaphanus] [Rhizophagus sp. MUCL 43196]